jgi:hypothetical protein
MARAKLSRWQEIVGLDSTRCQQAFQRVKTEFSDLRLVGIRDAIRDVRVGGLGW